MQFVNKTMTFSADAIVDGGRGKKTKISVSLYKREEGDTYVYLYDAGKWEKLKHDERHEIIQILGTCDWLQFFPSGKPKAFWKRIRN